MPRKLPFKRGKEESEMIAFFDYCRWKAATDKRYNLIFHVPNEGKSSPQRRVSMKRAGLKAGVPDIFIAVPRGQWGGLFIEMKVKPNRTTETQEWWLSNLYTGGYYTHIAWSAEEAIKVLEDYLNA